MSLTATCPSGARWRRWLTPSLADLFFPILLMAAFGSVSSWEGLLADGDTGWHIRTGQFILQTGTVPLHDLFSFSRPGQPWFAWEWLSDVGFAWLYGWRGLSAVAAFSAAVLCLSATLLLRSLLRRESGAWIAVPVALAAVSASTIHYLARPHIFTLLFVTVLLGFLEEDRRAASPAIWFLVPLLALWANLHAGFVCGLAILGLRAGVCLVERDRAAAVRYGTLAGLCCGATLLNPYGWQLHRHILSYLDSSWILNNVEEFQSPHIRSEGMQVFAVLLLAGVALVLRAFARKQWFDGALVLAWGFASLRSARHVPIYAVVAAPLIAQELAAWWAVAAVGSPAHSPVRVLWGLSQEFGRSRRLGLWTPLLGVLAIWMVLPQKGLQDFPEKSFPVTAVARNRERLTGPSQRILTSDQWADYLIFKLEPGRRVFVDGRSDFYGPAIGADYQSLMGAGRKWQDVLDRYRFTAALLPLDWPLCALLEHDPAWREVDRDRQAVLLVRREEPLKETRDSAECRFVGN